ncbi:MAG: hypothetical protein Q9181_008380, partial [Wetmoreana brouardii]
FIASKTKAALDGGLGVILCIGETLEVKKSSGKASKTNAEEYHSNEKAARPLTAIGTGKVATTEQAQEVHAEIRKWLSSNISKEASDNTRIIYGGSVNEKNCRDLAQQADIDGFLVGGASLKPA